MARQKYAPADGGSARRPSIAPTPPPPVMVVDDEPALRNLMSGWLHTSGYPVQSAATAEDALERQRATPAAVAVCDIRLPGRDGTWLMEQLRLLYPETALIVATGAPDVDSAVAGVRHGLVDYLCKPVSREQVCAAVGRGVARYRDAIECRMTPRSGHAPSAVWQPDPAVLRIQSGAALDGILATMVLRDENAFDHAHSVAELSLYLARELGIGESALLTIERAALLHEVGKLSLPDAILYKGGPLTPDELTLARQFPEIGYEMINGLWPFLAGAASIVRSVQEWFDGSGFARGLKGQAIPTGARIIAVADAYDAMTNPRAFKSAVSPAEAMEELQSRAGTQFDPRIVQLLAMSLGLALA